MSVTFFCPNCKRAIDVNPTLTENTKAEKPDKADFSTRISDAADALARKTVGAQPVKKQTPAQELADRMANAWRNDTKHGAK
jgi:hypothetical protein